MTDETPLAPDDIAPFDPAAVELLLGIPSDEDILFRDYLTYVANDGLLPHKATIHYGETGDGGKAGESLYTHLLNGIFVLEQLRRLITLDDTEARVLFCAFTLHDINKFEQYADIRSYRKIATVENILAEMTRLKLDHFFSGYDAYLEDIRSLMQRTSGHGWVGIDALDLTRAPRFGLHSDRLRDLLALMRAADAIDLSHTLAETRHKETFLHQFNSVGPVQYSFVTHQVAEQRGSLTNIIHNAAMVELEARFGLIPLLLYPEGVAYLCPRGREPAFDDDLREEIARRAAGTVAEMTSAGFQAFIRPINMGITVDRKCLELGLPFRRIFETIDGIVQRRPYKAEKLQQLAADAAARTREALAKRALSPDDPLAAAAQALLASGLVPQAGERMRLGELLRSYYIFLIEHLKDEVPEPWPHLYQLLELPAERAALYDLLNPRMDRAYTIALDLPLSVEDLFIRIVRDGEALLSAQTRADPRVPLLTEYLQLVLSFSGCPAAPADFAAALPTYVRQHHRQCVQCSLPLPTEPWMAANVRGDIKVQSFSNRLAGAPSEPKKRVCGICQLQYLVEKLNYREVRDEQPLYLHLFPYSFLAAPFATALRRTLEGIRNLDALSGALRLRDAEATFAQEAGKTDQRILFTTRTKEDKPQPYGLYLPRYSDTFAGLMTFPVNPPGDNDGEQFLFVLQHAMLLQRVLGSKVLVSTAATPPLDVRSFGDLYLDPTPLGARGLIRQNDYHWFLPGTKTPGSLQALWKQMERLYTVRRQLAVRTDDPMPALVRGLAEHPLTIFYVAEKLAEEKARSDRKGERGAAGWIIRRVAADVRDLALSTGDLEMSELDPQLQHLAAIAWRGGLRSPKSLEKNSLMTPLKEVFAKLTLLGDELSLPIIRAAAARDLFEHIKRVRTAEQLKAGRFLEDACREFVDYFCDEIFLKTYQGKLARLLSHEKILQFGLSYLCAPADLCEGARRQITRRCRRLDHHIRGGVAAMPIIDTYADRLLETYSAYPRGHFISLLLLRHVESEAIFRTEGSGEPLNKEFVFAGQRPGQAELIQRVVISKRKQTAVERRMGRELLREHDLLLPAGKEGRPCSLNTNNPCERCIDCMVYGYAAGGGGAQRSRVITDDAFSLHPAPTVIGTRQFNALFDNSTMRNPETGDPSTSIGTDEYVRPESIFFDIETLKDVTPDELRYVLGNVLRSTRYGAVSSRIGKVRNQLVGVAFSSCELFSNLRVGAAQL